MVRPARPYGRRRKPGRASPAGRNRQRVPGGGRDSSNRPGGEGLLLARTSRSARDRPEKGCERQMPRLGVMRRRSRATSAITFANVTHEPGRGADDERNRIAVFQKMGRDRRAGSGPPVSRIYERPEPKFVAGLRRAFFNCSSATARAYQRSAPRDHKKLLDASTAPKRACGNRSRGRDPPPAPTRGMVTRYTGSPWMAAGGASNFVTAGTSGAPVGRGAPSERGGGGASVGWRPEHNRFAGPWTTNREESSPMRTKAHHARRPRGARWFSRPGHAFMLLLAGWGFEAKPKASGRAEEKLTKGSGAGRDS